MNAVRTTRSRSARMQDALRHTAFHEAGHAVAAIHFRIRVKRVTIEPDGGRLGMVKHARGVDWETAGVSLVERGIREIILGLAGGEAERMIKGRYSHTGAGSDHEQAEDLADTLCAGMPAEARALLKYAALRTRRLVASDAWQAPIRAIAALLMEKKTLTGAEAKEAFHRALS